VSVKKALKMRTSRRAAYRRADAISSRSRYGYLERIASEVSPAARGCRMSITRMRIPRMHGRLPACSGSIVIRSRRSAFDGMSAPVVEHSKRRQEIGMLELARTPELPLLTLDTRLGAVAQAAGIELVEVP
jgi:hypothetical protein